MLLPERIGAHSRLAADAFDAVHGADGLQGAGDHLWGKEELNLFPSQFCLVNLREMLSLAELKTWEEGGGSNEPWNRSFPLNFAAGPSPLFNQCQRFGLELALRRKREFEELHSSEGSQVSDLRSVDA